VTARLGLSFDNLGEAAEIELGALAPDAPEVGTHFTVTEVLPRILDRLDEAGLEATFFVEGLNTELYPDALREIAGRGHELGFHAWRHEEWGRLPREAQAANLSRGLAGFERLGIGVVGMRPPGGRLGAGGLDVLREAGLRYCSPQGSEASVTDGVAVLPFDWSHVDAACVMPPMTAARERISGSPDPVDPEAFSGYIERELDRLAEGGEGFLTIILHPFMLEWLGEERLAGMLDRIASLSRQGMLEAGSLGASL